MAFKAQLYVTLANSRQGPADASALLLCSERAGWHRSLKTSGLRLSVSSDMSADSSGKTNV